MDAPSTRTTPLNTRCVVLHEPGVPPPAALEEALKRVDIRPVLCENTFMALARLCELDEAAPTEPLALLLVEPDTLSTAPALREAAQRYTPKAVCWEYRRHERPRLRASSRTAPVPQARETFHDDPARESPRAPGTARHGSGSGVMVSMPQVPTLRLVAEPSEGTNPPGTPAVDPESTDPIEHNDLDARLAPSPRATLTNDELTMLLGGDRDEPRR